MGLTDMSVGYGNARKSVFGSLAVPVNSSMGVEAPEDERLRGQDDNSVPLVLGIGRHLRKQAGGQG